MKTETENEIFTPKRGDRVLVWDNNEENAVERIFITEIEGAYNPCLCVAELSENHFLNGEKFYFSWFKNIKPIPKKIIPKDTLVWCKNNENDNWEQRFYSHFLEDTHYCFTDQKKSNENVGTKFWNIVTEINPFENS